MIHPAYCRYTLPQVSSQARQPDFHIHLRDRGEIPKECARQVGTARDDVARLEYAARCVDTSCPKKTLVFAAFQG